MSSVDFVNKVSAYILHKTTQTNSGKEPLKLNSDSGNICKYIRCLLYIILLFRSPFTLTYQQKFLLVINIYIFRCFLIYIFFIFLICVFFLKSDIDSPISVVQCPGVRQADCLPSRRRKWRR